MWKLILYNNKKNGTKGLTQRLEHKGVVLKLSPQVYLSPDNASL